jgi:hypothetical protein
MKFTILLKHEDNSTTPLTVSQIERTGPLNAATLGLTLAESQQVLAKVQQHFVEAQLQGHAQEQRIFPQCGRQRVLKDHRPPCSKNLFGGVDLRDPRFYLVGAKTRIDEPKRSGSMGWRTGFQRSSSTSRANWPRRYLMCSRPS